MSYRHVNKRTKILPIVTFRIAHLCNQFNHVRPANFHATFWSIYFYQNIPKINLFLQKNAKFLCAGSFAPRPSCLQRLGAFFPDPQPPAAVGFAPRPPKTAPQLRISGYAPSVFIAVMFFCVNWFCNSLMFMVFRKRLFVWTSLPTLAIDKGLNDFRFLLFQFFVNHEQCFA